MKTSIINLLILAANVALADTYKKVSCFDRMPNPSVVISVTPSDDDNFLSINNVAVPNYSSHKKYQQVPVDFKDDAGNLYMSWSSYLPKSVMVKLSINRVNLTGILYAPKLYKDAVVLQSCHVSPVN